MKLQQTARLLDRTFRTLLGPDNPRRPRIETEIRLIGQEPKAILIGGMIRVIRARRTMRRKGGITSTSLCYGVQRQITGEGWITAGYVLSTQQLVEEVFAIWTDAMARTYLGHLLPADPLRS